MISVFLIIQYSVLSRIYGTMGIEPNNQITFSEKRLGGTENEKADTGWI
jgi:hypothetical protein